jgi:hypothetical protein
VHQWRISDGTGAVARSAAIIVGMFHVDMLINAYARNQFFIMTHTQGYAHNDASLQPQACGNCTGQLELLAELPTT